jgi:hypothetical protein
MLNGRINVCMEAVTEDQSGEEEEEEDLLYLSSWCKNDWCPANRRSTIPVKSNMINSCSSFFGPHMLLDLKPLF